MLAGLWGMSGLASGCQKAVAQSTVPKSGALPLVLYGTPQQSGLLTGETVPGATIDAAGIVTSAGGDGRFVIGFDRDAPSTATIIATSGGRSASRLLTVAPRSYRQPAAPSNGQDRA
jgi:hypothetical protein